MPKETRAARFAVKSIAILATFSYCALDSHDIENKARELNCTAVMSVVEYHKTLMPHTHCVFQCHDQRKWTRQDFQELARNIHIKRLRTLPDVYRAMAYLGKEHTPDLWLKEPQHRSRELGPVLTTIWQLSITALSPDWQRKYSAQWTRLNAAWTPAFDSQDSQRDVVSENASQFFD